MYLSTLYLIPRFFCSSSSFFRRRFSHNECRIFLLGSYLHSDEMSADCMEERNFGAVIELMADEKLLELTESLSALLLDRFL